MSDSVPDDLREFVRLRAGRKCEYCLLHEEDARLSHEPQGRVTERILQLNLSKRIRLRRALSTARRYPR